MEQKKKDLIVIILIAISALLLILSFLAPIIFTMTTDNSRFDFNKTGPIGDTIGGLMNPFIALAGVFITFLAFYMQLKANQIQISLFNSNQIEQTNLLKEQMFFRLVDNLNQRIVNFSHSEKQDNEKEVEKTDFVSYKALDNIIKRFFYKIDYKCIGLGRYLLASVPDKIDEHHYISIWLAYTQNDIPSPNLVEDFRNEIINLETYNERWEYIKRYVGSTDSKNTKTNDALKAIGHVQFYKITFKEKESLYISTYDEIYMEHGGFMDGYLKNFSYLISFIDKTKKNEFFVDYLKSNISSQELILIFYFCASRKSTQTFRNQIKKLGLLDDLYISRERLIDSPSKDELSKEIEEVLKPSPCR